MQTQRRYWVTGASGGLGLALVKRLLEAGQQVAASGRPCMELDMLSAIHRRSLLRLPGALDEADQIQTAAQTLQRQWGALDGLVINAGTCDYLPEPANVSELFEVIASSNLRVSQQCLNAASPLLCRGQQPQVMAIVSRYAALPAPTHLPDWLREQRPALLALGIDLTVVAPQALNHPANAPQAIPEDWTADLAARELVQQLERRKAELVLEVLDPDNLWPLP